MILHVEGMWLHTAEWLEAAFIGGSLSECARVLGGIVAEVNAFEVDTLAELAVSMAPGSTA